MEIGSEFVVRRAVAAITAIGPAVMTEPGSVDVDQFVVAETKF